VYLREGGPTYRQWKWNTFFQPTFAAAALVAVGLALAQLVPRRRTWLATSVATGLCVVVGAVAYDRARPELGPPLAGDRPVVFTDVGLAHLEDAPALQELEQLNVAVDPWWDTMWVAYFLPDVDLYLQQPSYYAVSEPVPGWTLTERVGQLGGAPYVPVSERFQLEAPFDGPDSGDGVGLDATIEVESWSAQTSAGAPTSARVVITNTGTASWLPLEVGVGGVDLGVHLATETGQVVAHDYARQPLVPGLTRPILPGATVTVDVVLPAPPPGEHELQLQMVSEGVTWFGATAPVELVVV
jgi:hypothetical protein